MHLPQEKKMENQAKTPKSEKYYAVPEEDKRNYNIERPNLGKNANDIEDKSKLENESKDADDLGVE